MSELAIERMIDRATSEVARDGRMSTTTWAELLELGVDAQAIEQKLTRNH